MRIESFWAKGFRSLRDVRLEGLGAFNVFYGPNGAGKSNILAGIQTLFRLLAVIGREGSEALLLSSERPLGSMESVAQRAASVAVGFGLVARRDLQLRPDASEITLGATLGRGASLIDLTLGRQLFDRIQIEITLDWVLPGTPLLWLSQLDFDGKPVTDILDDFPNTESGLPSGRHVQLLLTKRLPARAFSLVDAIRALRVEPDDMVRRPDSANLLLQDMNEGHLASALFAAKNASDPDIRRQFRILQSTLQGEPLRRPPFDVLRDIATKEISIRERLSSSPDDERDVPLDLTGLGVVQIYTILAKILFAGTSTVGIEEPEAHLHAPTSGRHLRQLLVRLVEEKHIDQLFIATHSNLFDLDPTGYFDVSLDKDGCTVVRRADLTRIDREHLYEPGPAKHALQRMLEYTPPEEVVFRRGDGSPVTAGEMLRLLQEDDAVAVSFLQDVHGAAVRMVKVQSKKPRDAA